MSSWRINRKIALEQQFSYLVISISYTQEFSDTGQDNWDMVPSLLSSSRASPAAKRLTVRLLYGCHILFGRTLGRAVSNDIASQSLLTALSVHIQDIECRLLESSALASYGHEYLVEQERLATAMVISLFSVVSMPPHAIEVKYSRTTFRPKTTISIIRLLTFVMDQEECITPASVLYPLEQLNIASDMLIREDVVPLWGLGVWMEYQNPRTDIFLQLVRLLFSSQDILLYMKKATTYLRHKRHPNAFGQILADKTTDSDDLRRAVMTVMLELLSRYSDLLASLPPTKHISTSVMAVLQDACLLATKFVGADICSIRGSVDCCKALLILVLDMCQIEQCSTGVQ
ncbi:hypothetical protein SCLCIDRAFT_1210676 [Scleroderma citrinum Foug A]|uniref:Uncharacterized protein n=1 Tax=Scleroderma citrinum Foug A TaxID=1036808 RepID=A0A0C3A0J9_9AGAM|nr:hypothetical protein SCLCIDRAFT_1210676 [Scleroderma citrinum Foug A]